MAKTKIRVKNRQQLHQQLIHNGHTIRSFGNQIGVHPQTIHNVIDGKQNPSAKTARQIAANLNCPFDELFDIEFEEAVR